VNELPLSFLASAPDSAASFMPIVRVEKQEIAEFRLHFNFLSGLATGGLYLQTPYGFTFRHRVLRWFIHALASQCLLQAAEILPIRYRA
jgi:hypothetical protein